MGPRQELWSDNYTDTGLGGEREREEWAQVTQREDTTGENSGEVVREGESAGGEARKRKDKETEGVGDTIDTGEALKGVDSSNVTSRDMQILRTTGS